MLQQLSILGPNNELDYKELNSLYLNKEQCKLYGNGKSVVDPNYIDSLEGRIDRSTRIDLIVHGQRVNENGVEKHYSLYADPTKVSPTFILFNTIGIKSQGKPLYLHFWGCYGGLASKDIIYLPEGSILVTHCSSHRTSINLQSLFSEKKSLANCIDTSVSPYQEIMNNLPYYFRNFKFTQIYYDKIYRFKPNLDITKVLSSDNCLIDYLNEFKTFYHSLHPALKLSSNLDIPNITEYHKNIFKLGYLMEEIEASKTDEIKEILAEHIEELSKLDLDGFTLFHYSSLRGNETVFNMLLPYINNINIAVPTDNSTPLYLSSAKGFFDIAKTLLDLGANPNILTKDYNESPLFMAAAQGHVKVAELLLQRHANINQPNINGSFPLYLASQNGHTDVVKLLLKYGAEVDLAILKSKSTSLYIACDKNHYEIVKILLEHGAEANVQVLYNLTPLYIAIDNNNKDIVSLLLAHGANPNVQILNNLTPLYTAITNNSKDIVSLLLEHGANPNLVIKNGKTIIDLTKEAFQETPSEELHEILDLCERYASDHMHEHIVKEESVLENFTYDNIMDTMGDSCL
ncbi:MAG: hypothetical protein K0R02_1050 [Rickettsiaceae bacterium]|jgi:ankyrin repeat protein|nr:hypothetical protein [Rickettsiaceae bacterium]